ncbi:hypothetical protein ACIQW9_01875 [Herminiimonas sp. NPDC097707]|uniref:hypothetical protein n=1 Tax=Herminiimonas sp. NPDC097707 TaxID=3364007 RepID=UPI00383BD3F0
MIRMEKEMPGYKQGQWIDARLVHLDTMRQLSGIAQEKIQGKIGNDKNLLSPP